jgi:hypothetical protein
LEKNNEPLRSKVVIKNDRYNLKIKSDQEEDDEFCCAADEEAEAGDLGQIANKINKFENHNIN